MVNVIDNVEVEVVIKIKVIVDIEKVVKEK